MLAINPVGDLVLPEQVISEIRERLDMVALVGEYVPLTKRGSRHVGLCPFHAEKTPSFNVSATNKFYHCFGCQESGDAFSFLMRLEGISFPRAARALAERTGVEIPDLDRAEDAAERRARLDHERQLAVMDEAARFYERQLQDHPSAHVARAELDARTIQMETAKRFRLGYAPHAWDALAEHLSRKRVSMADAEALGLVSPRRGGDGHYDRFRGRLMFPIRELGGAVIAFSGRALPDPSTGAASTDPKYYNSSESPLYHKGDVLYGLHEARVEVRRTGWALLCEGNFDLLALHQAGIANALAPMGTAFTVTQAKLLARFAQRVTLMFDGDAAGAKAARAAFPVLHQHGLRGVVAQLPKGEDPDSYLRTRGAEALQKLLSSSQGIIEYLIDSAAERAGAHATERGAAVQELAPILLSVASPVEMELLLDRVAQRFGLPDVASVRRELRRGAVREVPEKKVAPSVRNSPVAQAPAHVRLPRLQAELVGILLDRPALFATPYASQLEAVLTSPELRQVFEAASAASRVQAGTLDAFQLLASSSSNPALTWIKERLALQSYRDRADAEETLAKGVRALVKEQLDEKRRRLRHEFDEAKRNGDDARAQELMKLQLELDRERSRLATRSEAS